jgi:hypothetical protein
MYNDIVLVTMTNAWKKQFQEEEFISAQGFSGFNPWSAVSIALKPETSWQQAWLRKAAQLMAARNQSMIGRDQE